MNVKNYFFFILIFLLKSCATGSALKGFAQSEDRGIATDIKIIQAKRERQREQELHDAKYGSKEDRSRQEKKSSRRLKKRIKVLEKSVKKIRKKSKKCKYVRKGLRPKEEVCE